MNSNLVDQIYAIYSRTPGNIVPCFIVQKKKNKNTEKFGPIAVKLSPYCNGRKSEDLYVPKELCASKFKLNGASKIRFFLSVCSHASKD